MIDKTKTWKLVEERLATETDPELRARLDIVLAHMKAEAVPDLDALMETLGPRADYHFWGPSGDHGPKGRDAVRTYYADFVASGANHLEFACDRVIVDRNAIVTEGFMTMLYPGRRLIEMGIAVDEADAYYEYHDRMLVVWPFDDDGNLIGEDSYSGQGGFNGIAKRKVANDNLPTEIRK